MNTTTPYNIYFDEQINSVVMIWTGYATSEQFREGSELMLNELIYSKARAVLADLREMVIIGLEDQKWLESTFIPRAIKFGFKQIAFLTPTSYFNKVAVESVTYKIDKEKLYMQFFENEQEAISWLKQ